VVRTADAGAEQVVSLRVPPDDLDGYRTLSLWLFHTPPGAVRDLPPGVPIAAATSHTRGSRALTAIAAAVARGERGDQRGVSQ
jgi:cellulose synthase (UDP-forming)